MSFVFGVRISIDLIALLDGRGDLANRFEMIVCQWAVMCVCISGELNVCRTRYTTPYFAELNMVSNGSFARPCKHERFSESDLQSKLLFDIYK